MKKTKNSLVFSQTNFISYLSFVFSFLVLISCTSNSEDDLGDGTEPTAPTDIIHDGNVYLKNQHELNTFAKKGYTIINGTLVIGVLSDCDITSLKGLESLTQINGGLNIQGTINLNSLEGLNNIRSTQFLSIMDADKITHIDELKNIKSIVDDNEKDGLWVSLIVSNDNLVNIDGLSNLENYKGVLEILNNKSLLNVDGLKNINSFSARSISIIRNESLKNIDGLSVVNSLSNLLDISENNSLENLNGLNNLSSVKNTCFIRNNRNLKNLCAIENLAGNGEDFDLYIDYNAYNPTRQDIIDGNCSQ
ncbi:hypothetical protein [Tenacibaculum sp. 190130A14a]